MTKRDRTGEDDFVCYGRNSVVGMSSLGDVSLGKNSWCQFPHESGQMLNMSKLIK